MIDAKLAGLETATDDSAMRAILSGALGHGRWPVQGVRHSILKHAPGKHCVIEYLLDMDGAGEKRLIGKLYREHRGARHFGHLQRVHEHAAPNGDRSEPLGVPEPLAYIAELEMVLLRAAPGTELSRLPADADWNGATRAVADNLAILHDLTIPAETRTMADALRRVCRPSPGELVEMRPDLASPVENVLRALALVEPPREGACLVHGDLGLGQILISEGRATFVDLDSICRSHAALDVANFLVSLRLRLGPSSAEPEREFLGRYRRARPAESLAELDAYQALAYLRRAAAAFRPPSSLEAQARGERLLGIANWIARAAMESVPRHAGSSPRGTRGTP